MERYEQMKMGERGVWVSIFAYLSLSIVKIIIGSMTFSQALIADGVNNATDIIGSVAVLIGLKVARKPPDENHPYGHYRAETIASLIASLIMVAVGVQVLVQAVGSLSDEKMVSPDLSAAWIAMFGALLMYLVYRYNSKLARTINSQAVMASAKDNLSDVWVSIGTAVGIIGSQFGLAWLDPLAASLVGILICKTGWDIFWEAAHNLTDGFDKERLNDFRDTIEPVAGVEEVKEIKARVHGSNVLVDVVILVDPRLNVVESHEISEEIEKRMRRKYNVNNVHVHIEPTEVQSK
ncbi:cation diffusion facilitator family transporter [Effusibacillus consociatus]|uniref:Cation diffusion facilitator family transporter n=1 Tax=Effusibacillus consociatus TaxID=1117041 RepID=A0ABV9PXV7_9BACL